MTHPWVSVDTHSTRPHRTNTVHTKCHRCAIITWQWSPSVQNESTHITSRPPQSTSYISVCSVSSTGCWTFQSCHRERLTVQRVPKYSGSAQFTDEVVDVPMVARSHDSMISSFLRAQKTVSVPQALKTDRAVDVSVVTQSQDSISRRVQTAVLAPQAQSIDETMGNPECATESKFSAVLTKTLSGHAETDADHPDDPED